MAQLGKRGRTANFDPGMSFLLARPRRPRCGSCRDLASGCRRLTAVIMMLAGAAIFGAAPSAIASPRLWQPLLLKGIQLYPLLDTRVDRLEVLAVHGGILEPIPFQVDAVLPNGKFVLSQGSLPSTGHRVQTVGEGDELAIMMFDLGERATPPVQLPDRALEIVVTDPLGGPARYAYIAATRNPRRSTVHYVDYDPKLERIETDHYRLAFRHQLPDDFRLQNHRREDSKNLISGFELRGQVAVLSLLKFRLTESDIDSRLLAYRVGPVRVIRRLGHRFRVFLGFHSPEVSSIEFFYRDFAQAPFTMRLPLRRLFRSIQGRIAMDFIDLDGFALLASGLNTPIEIGDGPGGGLTMPSGDAPAADWLALRGDGRLMMQTFVPSEDLSLIDRRLYYRTDRAGAHDDANGAAVGIQTTGWERLSGGSHRFNPLLISVPESYGAKRLIAESSAAPVVTVQPVATSNLPPAGRGLISQMRSTFAEDGK
ncbi:MAG: hypothetical protein ACLQU2_33775 [Candidatus Binataceae bacterium]